MSDIAAALNRYLDPGAVDRLRIYFLGPSVYTGRRFERLAGGGDGPETSGRFTSDDLVAVTMLGVTVPGDAALEILENQGDELNSLLAEIPNGVDLWDAPRSVVEPGSPADRLWHRLDEVNGVGWVTAGKLLARKRPRLIPVYDRIVRAAIGVDDSWLSLHDALQNPELRDRLSKLRDQSSISEDISLLRVLDIAIWMSRDMPLTNP